MRLCRAIHTRATGSNSHVTDISQPNHPECRVSEAMGAIWSALVDDTRAARELCFFALRVYMYLAGRGRAVLAVCNMHNPQLCISPTVPTTQHRQWTRTLTQSPATPCNTHAALLALHFTHKPHGAKHTPAVDTHFDAIARDLLREMGSRTWRGRQAAAAALADLLQGRRWDQLGPHLKEVREGVGGMTACRTVSFFVSHTTQQGDLALLAHRLSSMACA